MNKIIVLAGLLALPAASLGQVSASMGIRLDLPVVLPQLVVVAPGIQVVPEVNEEVFFVDGLYWVRKDGGWYRSRSPRAGWALAPVRAVPVRLVEIPRGKYKRYKPAKAERRDDHGDHHDHGERDHGHGHGKGKHGKGHGKD